MGLVTTLALAEPDPEAELGCCLPDGSFATMPAGDCTTAGGSLALLGPLGDGDGDGVDDASGYGYGALTMLTVVQVLGRTGPRNVLGIRVGAGRARQRRRPASAERVYGCLRRGTARRRGESLPRRMVLLPGPLLPQGMHRPGFRVLERRRVAAGG